MTRAHYFVLTLAFALSASISSAQVTTGTPPFGSFGGGPDIINLANLNLHISIPVLHKLGRGGFNFTYDLSYDSSVWSRVTSGGTTGWQPITNWGWRGQTEAATGYIAFNATVTLCYTNRIPTGTISTLTNWVFHDSWGIPHPFAGTAISRGGSCGTFATNFTSTTTDGSGYTLTTNAAGTPPGSVYSSAGKLHLPPANSTSGSGSGTDRNGNQISVNSSGVFTDTLGTTALTVAGTAPTSTTFTYTAPSGANAAYTMSYKTYTVKTNFGCSGIAEYGPTSNSLVDRVTLPDGSFYQFNYEPTPGFSGDYTGRLASVILPTGGTITYSYSGGSNGISCADGSTATLTRTTPDGTWTYAQVKGSGAASTTTVTDPQSNVTTIQFQGIYETQRQVSGLLTTNTCYNGAASPCNSTAITLPITQRTVITTLPNNLQSKHFDSFSAFGMPTESDDYDYGSGAPGALLRKTTTTYASLGNINAFRQQVTVYNGAGTQVSQTNYNYDETAVTATSGTPQHVSVSGSRGNLTSINYPAGGLTTHSTYYDTGTMNTSTDVNGAVTTNSYAGSSCGNSFPTSVSEPLGLSRFMTWNCTGGVQLTTTDENGQTVTTTYNDPYFWRPNAVADQASNTLNIGYGASGAGGLAFTPYMYLNNNNSIVAVAHNLDGLGRSRFDQRYQSPTSQTYDTVSYTYDANGRPYSTSLPCSVGGALNCPGSTPKTTQTYDALNRPLLTTDGGGGTASYSYTGNDVYVAIGPAPSGENTKRRQLEYDALGRLTSVCEITGATGSGACGQNVAQTGFWTKYTYDTLNNLTGVTQNAQATSQQTRSYSYDAVSRLTSETNPESGTKNYTYDSDSAMCGNGASGSPGDLVKTVDAAGNCVMLYYDSLHRLTDVGSNSGCKRFRYDNTSGVLGSIPSGISVSNVKGRLTEAETDTCAWPITQSSIITDEWFSYTARRETSDVYESTPHSGGYYHSFATYWPNGLLYQVTATGGYGATWNVDGEGRIYSSLNGLSSTSYNAASQPTQLTLASGDSDTFGYDPGTGRMNQYKFNVNGQSVVGNLTWNANGTLQAQSITDPFNGANTQNCSYAYDDVTRLASANCGSAAAQTFTYNGDGSGAFGNITKTGSPFSFTPTYSSASNRMTNINGFIPSYDNDGNVLNDNSHTYSWNAFGRPVTIDGVSITYDALGRMLEQNRSGTYTQFLYSPTGFNTSFMSGQAPQKTFVPLVGGVAAVYANGTIYFQHPDWLGSSRLVSAYNRTMYSDQAYAPFGEPYAQAGANGLSFTGMNQDTVSGLYDFPAREYSIQGRWPSPDPAGLAAVDPSNPQSWNRYAYVLNNPLALVDPSGLNECAPGEHDCNVGLGEGDPGSDILGGTPCCIDLNSVLEPVATTAIFDALGGGNFTFVVVQNPLTPPFAPDTLNVGDMVSGSWGPSNGGGGGGGNNWLTAKILFTTNPFPTAWQSLKSETGCGHLIAETFFGDLSPVPLDTTPGITDAIEPLTKFTNVTSAALAIRYAAGQPNVLGGIGLIKPFASGTFRSLWSLSKFAEEVAAPATIALSGVDALARAGTAAYKGTCQ